MTIIFSRKTCPYYKMCTSFSKKNNCHLFKLLNHCILYSTIVFFMIPDDTAYNMDMFSSRKWWSWFFLGRFGCFFPTCECLLRIFMKFGFKQFLLNFFLIVIRDRYKPLATFFRWYDILWFFFRHFYYGVVAKRYRR